MGLEISTFKERPFEANRSVVDVLGKPDQIMASVAIGASNAQSVAITSPFVRICPTANCRIAIGSNPDASAGGEYFAANVAEVRLLTVGDKLAVVAA